MKHWKWAVLGAAVLLVGILHLDRAVPANGWGLSFQTPGTAPAGPVSPERLAELFSCACTHKLEPKRLCLLRHKEDGPVSLVMVQCRKGAKPGLIWQEQSLHRADGTPTDYYRSLYHLQEV